MNQFNYNFAVPNESSFREREVYIQRMVEILREELIAKGQKLLSYSVLTRGSGKITLQVVTS